MILVEEMKEQDRAYLAQLFYSVRREEFDWVTNAQITDFEKATEGERIYVARENDAICGFIAIWEPAKFIHHLFVDKTKRKAGAGRALIAYAASVYGYPLTLKCVAANHRALHFYGDIGFRIAEEGVSEDGGFYTLTLSPKGE